MHAWEGPVAKVLFSSRDNLLLKALKLSPMHRAKTQGKEIKGVAYGYKTVGCLTMGPS